MEVTRRNFITGAAAGTIGAIALGGMAVDADASEPKAADSAGAAPEAAAPKGFTPGVYVGSAEGNSGTVYVKVVLGEGPTIEDVQIVGNSETDHVIHDVEQVLPQRILDAQSTDVQTVAGATFSSFAVLYAVEDALEQAGIDPSSLEAPASQAADTSVECQALVIGSGPAGLLSALTLKKRGVDVLLVEQLEIVGGTGRFSAGRMFGTMEEAEQERVEQAFMEQTTDCAKAYDETLFPNQDKIDQYITAGSEMFSFLTDDCGIALEYYAPVDGYGNSNTKIQIGDNDYSDITSAKGYQLTESLYDIYVGLGGRTMLGVTVESLIQDADGTVTGATGRNSAGSVVISADYVVVCTGSAGANKDIQAKYCPERSDMGDPRTICKGADGSGIEMMLSAGAQVIPDWINSVGQFTTHPELACTTAAESIGSKFALANSDVNKACLYVDNEGRRLGNEANAFITRLFYKTGSVDAVYGVTDVDNATSRKVLASLETGLRNQPEYYFKADTIEGLAEAAGLDAETLAATVQAYNEHCANGVDGDFGKDAKYLVAVKTAPYYLVKEVIVNRDIAGGVYTDLNRNVLDASGNVIPGLFAAGFCSSRDMYANGIPGAGSVGMSAVTGYVAANYIADQLGL